MKKLFLSILSVTAFTLLSQAQFKVGITGGSNLNEQRINVKSGTMYAGDRLKGYHAGLIADIHLGGNFYLQPQLLFSRKSAGYYKSTSTWEAKVRLSYIELPVNVLYRIELPFGKVLAGAGAAFGYAAGGSEQQNGITTKLFSGPVKKWKRSDISMNMLAGLEFNNGLFASINYQKGFLDIYKGDEASIKNRSVSVSVGYIVTLN